MKAAFSLYIIAGYRRANVRLPQLHCDELKVLQLWFYQFLVISDQNSAVISVQAVNDVGYCLTRHARLLVTLNFKACTRDTESVKAHDLASFTC